MTSNLKKSSPEGQISQSSSSAQIPVPSDPGAIDLIQVLNSASPFILLISLAYIGKQFVDSLCRLIEAIKEK